jgi:hypothetical protein
MSSGHKLGITFVNSWTRTARIRFSVLSVKQLALTAVPGNGWENQALFDYENRALPAMNLLNQP